MQEAGFCIILYYLGYSRSRSRRLLLLSAITISVHMCVSGSVS
jgi:hypothetical protein